MNRDKPESCCQGKCHLKKQIEKNAETSDTEEKNANKKILSQEVHEFIFSRVSIPKATEISLPRIAHAEIVITMQVASSIFVPPQHLPFPNFDYFI